MNHKQFHEAVAELAGSGAYHSTVVDVTTHDNGACLISWKAYLHVRGELEIFEHQDPEFVLAAIRELQAGKPRGVALDEIDPLPAPAVAPVPEDDIPY